MTHKFHWLGIFFLSTMILILRAIDFIDEASRQDFHMTRVGLNIYGDSAMLLQLVIVSGVAFITWKASAKLIKSN